METAPDLGLKEAIFLRSTSYCINTNQNSLHCQHKRLKDHNKYTLENDKNWSEKNEIKFEASCFLGALNMKINWIKKIRLL